MFNNVNSLIIGRSVSDYFKQFTYRWCRSVEFIFSVDYVNTIFVSSVGYDIDNTIFVELVSRKTWV